jgi:hypothetical protein
MLPVAEQDTADALNISDGGLYKNFFCHKHCIFETDVHKNEKALQATVKRVDYFFGIKLSGLPQTLMRRNTQKNRE